MGKAATALPDTLLSGAEIGISKEHIKRLGGKYG